MCWLLVVSNCLLFCVRRLLCVSCFCRLSFVARCVPLFVCCLLFVVCIVVCVVCVSLFIVCYSLFVACCFLFVVCGVCVFFSLCGLWCLL